MIESLGSSAREKVCVRPLSVATWRDGVATCFDFRRRFEGKIPAQSGSWRGPRARGRWHTGCSRRPDRLERVLSTRYDRARFGRAFPNDLGLLDWSLGSSLERHEGGTMISRQSRRPGFALLALAVASALAVLSCGAAPMDSTDDAREHVGESRQALVTTITTLAQLRAMQPNGNYELGANIDASATASNPFVPIGSFGTPSPGLSTAKVSPSTSSRSRPAAGTWVCSPTPAARRCRTSSLRT